LPKPHGDGWQGGALSWQRGNQDEFFYLKIILATVAVIAVIAGLIEWNARRQAAALTREMLRPATAQEQTQLKAMTDQWEAEAAAETQQLREQLRQNSSTPQQQRRPRFDPRPLSSDERCIDHQRFQRVSNGWEQIGSC
jgi:hypothetical protein